MSERVKTASALCIVLILADIAVWQRLILGRASAHSVYHALDVGQGDATVLRLRGGATVMTDAGPDSSVISSLERVVPGVTRIDIAIISHPQLDHFNGFNYLVDQYAIGAFIINGRSTDGEQWEELLRKIKEKQIPLITLGAGDKIKYGSSYIAILSPGREFKGSGELNDTSLIEYVRTPEWTALLAGDAGMNIEGYLFKEDLPVDILKVGHHGSKYSTGDKFLGSIRPEIGTISVSSKNTYGHPAAEALDRLRTAKVTTFRTDQHGNISIWKKDGRFRVKTGKIPN